MSIEERVITVIYDSLENQNDQFVSLESTFTYDLGYDSVKLMGFFFSLEQEFDIPIISSNDNYMYFSAENVKDIVEILASVVED